MSNNNPILIVGLGNPGKSYSKTRHNVGFQTLDSLRAFFNFPAFTVDKKWNASISLGQTGRQRLILAKPQSFMNNSGPPVKAIAAYLKIPPERIWVIHDDLDLPVGSVKMRENGGSAGHNGVDSIRQHLGTDRFWRFKIGIGQPAGHEEMKSSQPAGRDYVLANFGFWEKGKIKKSLAEIITRLQEKLDQLDQNAAAN